MPVATLSIPPSAEHVRTARLVAVAAARRAGLDEPTVDDVRLAVGEAVARAVLRHSAAEVVGHVELVLRDDGHGFEVEVHDRSTTAVPDDDEGVSLALVEALVPEVRTHGEVLVLAWPLSPSS